MPLFNFRQLLCFLINFLILQHSLKSHFWDEEALPRVMLCALGPPLAHLLLARADSFTPIHCYLKYLTSLPPLNIENFSLDYSA